MKEQFAIYKKLGNGTNLKINLLIYKIFIFKGVYYILKELELDSYDVWNLFKCYSGRSVRDTYFITKLA
jgi:hypothetical protein